MAISAWDGPLVSYGGNPANTGESNPERGPCSFDCGFMLGDPRQVYTYHPGQTVGQATYGWYGGAYLVVDQIPSAIADNNIAALQTPGGGVRTITLVSAAGAGITLPVAVTNGSTGAAIAGLLAIDVAMTPIGFGDYPAMSVWDPTKSVARAVRITSGGNDTGVTFTVNGYDLYGFKLTEAITGANAGIAAGKKAFKYIASITNNADVATTVKVGTSDIYGLPLRSDRFGNTQLGLCREAICWHQFAARIAGDIGEQAFHLCNAVLIKKCLEHLCAGVGFGKGGELID